MSTCDKRLRPFLRDDYPVFDEFRSAPTGAASDPLPLVAVGHGSHSSHGSQGLKLAHSAFQPHIIWSDLLDYRWAVIDNAFYLFATSHGVTHLALPPLAKGVEHIESAVEIAFEIMADLNPKHIDGRIDNVNEPTAKRLEQAGYTMTSTPPDYLYRRDEIVHLTGNRFRSQRAATNQVACHQPTFRPFLPQDTNNCLALFDQWQRCPIAVPAEEINVLMREDAHFAHVAAMRRENELGLIGRVVEIAGVPLGYTFGLWLAPDQFCVLIEIADRSIRGLSAWLFREFCREQQGAKWINAMDDSGLPCLAHAKALWHPVSLIPSYTVRA